VEHSMTITMILAGEPDLAKRFGVSSRWGTERRPVTWSRSGARIRTVDLCLGARHVDVDEVRDDGLALGERGRVLLVGAVGSGESFVVLAEVLFPGGDVKELDEGVVVLAVAVKAPADGAGSGFPEELQGEISGLSRSVSNLGSSFGTAIAGTILVSVVATGTTAYAWAMAALAVFGVIGLVAALLLPSGPKPQTSP